MKWWLRLQMGQTLIGSAISLTMLAMNLSPTIGKYLGCRAIWPALVLPLCIGALLLTVGYMMDRCRWMQRQDDSNRARSTTWEQVFERLDRIEGKMDRGSR